MTHSQQTKRWLTPRIWRSARGNFHEGLDTLHAVNNYDSTFLQQVGKHGFDAIWIRGRLRDLMLSVVFPELNCNLRDQHIASLHATIERAAKHGVNVFLFFNEPLALAANDPFWVKHPELRGGYYVEHGNKPCYSLCTSLPAVQSFMAEAVDSIMRELPGLGGVILITATELHTHCWSHHARFGLDDGIVDFAKKPLDCVHCRDREPADVVTELVAIWERMVHGRLPEAKVLVWNWSWSLWYADPQREVIEKLPKGVELLADFERGAARAWYDRQLVIDEYSLSFIGPGDRFKGSQEAAKNCGMATSAKLQIGATHEMASVPNIPLVKNLHGKMVELYRRNVAGAMCAWAIGCSLTMNTFAMGLFGEDPARFCDAEIFFDALAQRYLGLSRAGQLTLAWQKFGEAFDRFPFSIRFLYFGPMNIAPGIALTSHFRKAPLTGTWRKREDYGDCFESACFPFSILEAATALKDMADLWQRGLEHINLALNESNIANRGELAMQHRFEEYSCAQMVGIQLRSVHHLLAFGDWRLRKMASLQLQGPCDVPLDDEARKWMTAELANIAPAVALAEKDARLGMHDEAQTRQYDAASLLEKMSMMQRELEA